MRFLLMFRSTALSEAGVRHDQDFLDRRATYVRSLANAGKLLADESLVPSSSGLRISFPPDGSDAAVASGPFAVGGGLTEGFLIMDTHSIEEAAEWAKKFPVPRLPYEITLELRQLLEPEEIYRDPNAMAMRSNLQEQMDVQT